MDWLGFEAAHGALVVAGAWVALLSLWLWVLMAWDKARARARGRRVSERALLTTAWLGGAPGLAVAMRSFRHKTRHQRFVITAFVAGTFWASVLVVTLAILVWVRLRS